MIAFTTHSHTLADRLPLAVGVFEDDALLLGLAEHFRLAEAGCRNASDQIDSDDLAFENRRLMDSRAWDL
jgi:hypothetical protein